MENQEEMCRLVRDYFVIAFAELDGDIQYTESPRRVTQEQNAKLTEEVSFEEFTLSIKHMHLDKTSGPNGLNHAFYQSF